MRAQSFLRCTPLIEPFWEFGASRSVSSTLNGVFTMFCSTSVSVHLLRGAAAIALIFAAIFFSSYGLLWSALAGIAAVVLLRGCPMCWMMGLFETMQRSRAQG